MYARDRVDAKVGRKLHQQQHAALIGGHLRGDVGQVSSAARVGKGRRSKTRAKRLRDLPGPALDVRISTPSSARFRQNGGIEPGVMPPISA